MKLEFSRNSSTIEEKKKSITLELLIFQLSSATPVTYLGTWIHWTRVLKKWLIAKYFWNSSSLLQILPKRGIWLFSHLACNKVEDILCSFYTNVWSHFLNVNKNSEEKFIMTRKLILKFQFFFLVLYVRERELVLAWIFINFNLQPALLCPLSLFCVISVCVCVYACACVCCLLVLLSNGVMQNLFSSFLGFSACICTTNNWS